VRKFISALRYCCRRFRFFTNGQLTAEGCRVKSNVLLAIGNYVIMGAYMEKRMQFTAVFMAVPEGYIGFVEEFPGANTQGDTLEEARENLQEAVQMVLDANREIAERAIVGRLVSREPFDLSKS
jgi:predicted RNase H-like HicB family nuclease